MFNVMGLGEIAVLGILLLIAGGTSKLTKKKSKDTSKAKPDSGDKLTDAKARSKKETGEITHREPTPVSR
jgi:hypothetical protein